MADDPISVEVHGFDELAEGSEQLFDRIGDEAAARFLNVADQKAAAVASRVPRVSGALAASVVSDMEGETAIVGMGSDDVPYAGWIEFGGEREGRGGGIAERPYIAQGRYLYPTALNAEPLLAAAGTEAAEDEIERFRWATPRP